MLDQGPIDRLPTTISSNNRAVLLALGCRNAKEKAWKTRPVFLAVDLLRIHIDLAQRISAEIMRVEGSNGYCGRRSRSSLPDDGSRGYQPKRPSYCVHDCAPVGFTHESPDSSYQSNREAPVADLRERLHIPRARPGVSDAVLGWGIGLFLIWAVIWICFR